MTSLPYFPDDILYIVCAQLRHQRDFNTLFKCACSGKQLATIALTNLYRTPSVGSNDFKKRTLLWRTLIRSSLGTTLLPYCQYVWTLNFGDLEELLSDSKFKTQNSRKFFEGELGKFRVYKCQKFRSRSQLNIYEIISRIGEVMTRQTTLLEELTDNVPSSTLSRWVPRLPRLTHLKLRQSATVEGIGSLIRLHCPIFKRLDMLKCVDANSDQDMASFLNELRPQSLESFEAWSSHYLGRESFQALSCHGESLTQLKLSLVFSDANYQVLQLRGCTNLVSLSLAGTARITDGDAFLEAVAWLKACKNLRVLAFIGSFSTPALMVPVLMENSITLTSLEYDGFVMRDIKEIHQALANQTSLQSLSLKERADEDGLYSLEEADDLVESISKLINLTDLRLTGSSDSFADRHVLQLASNLPKLEFWSMRGLDLTDAIWDQVASLKSLRKLDLGAMTSFTPHGILSFIEELGAGNKGLVFSILSRMNMNIEWWVEQDPIRDVIAEKVQGTLEFTSDPRVWFRIDPEELGPDMSLFPDQVEYW